MLLVKNTVKNHCPILHSTVRCSYQSVEKMYKIMVLHLGTASPLLDGQNTNQQWDEVSESRHSPPGNWLQVLPREGQQHISMAAAELLSYSNQPSQSKIIRKGNLYAKFNRLILTLTTWCRKIDRPFEISASAGSCCVSDLPQCSDQSCQFPWAGRGEERFPASLCQDMTVQLQKDQTARSWVTE